LSTYKLKEKYFSIDATDCDLRVFYQYPSLYNILLNFSASSSEKTELDPNASCNYTLVKKKTLGVDPSFWKKFFKHLIPFTSSRGKMEFILFKRDFADCGKELFIGDVENLKNSGFNARHQTR